MLGCLWNRSRLEAHAAGRLGGRAERSVARHASRCERCRRVVDTTARMRRLVGAAGAAPAEPDWTGFWPAVRSRIATEPARPVRESWWMPWWKPIWGHPRLAASAVAGTVLALGVSFWPASDELLTASASPVVVQDVAAADPRGSVMVYSSRDATVIWVFADASGRDE